MRHDFAPRKMTDRFNLGGTGARKRVGRGRRGSCRHADADRRHVGPRRPRTVSGGVGSGWPRGAMSRAWQHGSDVGAAGSRLAGSRAVTDEPSSLALGKGEQAELDGAGPRSPGQSS